ncbi:MAG: glycoside hydrolase family 3 C-terminal domain-containing protein, partial [Muribaculaceae bacterium]|nr:glycoside hydrolase family 3 C-terminal domain-containing protein [Muribaculaceae bacterium]
PNIVLVLQTCSSMTVNWAQEHVPAIVEAWYDGQAQGQAIADVLYGDFNPSGHLTSTWYSSLSALPSTLLNYDIRNAGYTYMYHKGTPLYSFGHGLSYTEFEYSDMTLSSEKLNKDEEITVSATIKNIGDRAGADVVQLYARCQSEIDRPQLQLVGFARVELEPGESRTVSIPLKHEQLCYFNSETQTFDVEEGTVELMLAESAAEIRLKSSLTTQGATVKLTYKSDPSSVKGIVEDFNGINKTGYFDLTGRYLGNSFERLAPGYYVTKGKVVRK